MSVSSESVTLSRPSSLTMTQKISMVISATLIMGAGWGIRGAFGHSRGAMMPGAMLGLTLAVCSLREDWRRRTAIIGFLSAIGWGFGGASSYGLLIGYSMGGTWINSAYGYLGLCLVGALYSGIGCSFLALGLTRSRSFLERSVGPMVILYVVWLLLEFFGYKEWSLELFKKDPETPEITEWLYDTLWLWAVAGLVVGLLIAGLVRPWREQGLLIAMLSAGWFAGMFVLIKVAGLRINPSRGDTWAGCLGIQLVLLAYFLYQQNRSALMLTFYGLLAGGYGFPIGDFWNALGRAKWGPIHRYPILQEFGYWTVMEQTFGYVMGFGVALGILRLIQGQLQPAIEDIKGRWLNPFCVFILMGLLFAFNFLTNYIHWTNEKTWVNRPQVTEEVLGLPSGWVLSAIAAMILSLLAIALYRQQMGKLDIAPASTVGKSKLLALIVIWMVMAIYIMLPRIGLPTSLMFFVAIGIGTLFIVLSSSESIAANPQNCTQPNSLIWRLGWRHWLLWGLLPLTICGLATITMKLEIPAKQIRFPAPAESAKPDTPES